VAHERRATADRPPDPRPHGVGDRGGRPRPLEAAQPRREAALGAAL